MNELRIHFWLPEETTYGEKPKCDNCKHFGEHSETHIGGKCGRSGWICGIWEEAEETQTTMF